MKIFITGGSGFIGLPTVRHLLQGGHRLLVLSRNPRKFKMAVRSRNIEFIKGDLYNISRLRGSIKKFKPDAALHMAWEGIPDYGVQMSLKNLIYSFDLISVLKESGCKKIVSTGSCWEYGVDSGKVKEEHPARPKTPFSAAKVSLRTFGAEMARAAGMQFFWPILFFVYGPGQKRSSLIPSLVVKKNNNLPPSVNNLNGGNDFIFVDDVARAIALFATKKIKGPGGIYNVGSGSLTSVKSVADIIYKGKFKRYNAKGFCADISKIKREFGWSPKIGILKGIEKTVKYYLNEE